MDRITLRMDNDEDLRELFSWIRDDSYLRANSGIGMTRVEQAPDAMGASFEAIKIVIESGFALANLAIAIATYRQARRSREPLTITYNEVTITMPASEAADGEAVLAALEKARS
ncbi:hypothetical protein [Nonomuraea sp. NPDC049480]|uniref:effector-associated constant component EACC1 n=1 Tax=Nonomuraea sp. NPDC049480 TaxID=3364353 RepID=UPI003799D496